MRAKQTTMKMYMWARQNKRIPRIGVMAVLVGTVVGWAAPTAMAAACATNANQQSCSSNYGVNETYFGSGGQLHACGTSYCAKQSLGELGVGNSKGTTYQGQGGFNTDRYPSLTLLINDSQCAYYGATTNAGVLSTSSTKTLNSNFSVKAYLSSGYVVQTVGAGPTYGSHTLAPMTAGGSSSAGTEQFGMNLVANTSPTTFGAAPQQLPDSTFAFGSVASGYNTANQFKYNNYDVIAQSTKSSSTTCYALSYIFNISTNTPSGVYSFNQAIVATATY